MAKLFAIQIEVEEIAVGKVMRQLSKMPGVAKLNLDIEHKPNGVVRGPYKKHEGAPKKTRADFAEKGEDVLAQALFKKSPQTHTALGEMFKAIGRSHKSINSLLHNMRGDGLIERNDDGWALTKKMKDRMRHRKARS
jgi:hypothetical protein